MYALKYIVYFIFICLNILLSPLNAEDACVRKTACSCEFSNGTGIDLSDSAKSSFYTTKMFDMVGNGTQYKMFIYYFHPCFDVVPNINVTTPDSTCGGPLTICRHKNILVRNDALNTYKLVNDTCEFMGSSNVTEFAADGRSIKYINGPSSTVVELICAQTDDKLEVYSLTEPNDIILAFYSRNACLRELEAIGRSTGSTLLIVLFSLVIFYLVLGVCTKKFLMGATGVEVVPNLAFWSDLPNLVKDGWAFALNGFKLPARGAGPATSPDPNSYDSI